MDKKKIEKYYIVKNLIIGDSAVGKTCILLRFSDDAFTNYHLPTIGIYFPLYIN